MVDVGLPSRPWEDVLLQDQLPQVGERGQLRGQVLRGGADDGEGGEAGELLRGERGHPAVHHQRGQPPQLGHRRGQDGARHRQQQLGHVARLHTERAAAGRPFRCPLAALAPCYYGLLARSGTFTSTSPGAPSLCPAAAPL